jgi:hypothetical protein
MLRPSMRGGVPVFRRPRGAAIHAGGREPVRRRIAGAAAGVVREADVDLAPRKVPAVSTTQGALNAMPIWVTTPATGRPRGSGRRPPAGTSEVRLVLEHGADGLPCTARGRPAQRVARTAGPLEAFSVRNWMPARSAARAIAPPSASISLTRWPLPMPPMAGLQLIWPRSRCCARAAASAHPARRRERGFGAGVAAADHDDVVGESRRAGRGGTG